MEQQKDILKTKTIWIQYFLKKITKRKNFQKKKKKKKKDFRCLRITE